MEANQRLTSRLVEIEQFGPEDISWYHFVRDHKKYLKNKSKTRTFTPEQLVKYRYRPNEFYVDQCCGQLYMAWIFLFVNDIRDPEDFNENHTKFFMVTPDSINELFRLYSTSENQTPDEELSAQTS